LIEKKNKKQFISLPFHVANTTIRNSSHLMEMSEMLTSFNLKEGELLRGFDPKGIFFKHLTSMRYTNLFTRITEGIGDRNPNTLMKKDKHACDDYVVMKVSTITQSLNITRQRGRDMNNIQSYYVPHPHMSSSSTQRKQESNLCRGENNGHARGDDGEDFPLVDIEKSHVVS
jgi:hypothetical protein